MKYYDSKNNRLVYEEEEATSAFWDNHWKCEDIQKEILKGKNDFFVSGITKKFIAPGRNKKILEGGCGNGQYVYSLKYRGYDSYGIDYARELIRKINEAVPKLKIKYGNINNLDFPNNFFDGYWSLGVIEHFFDSPDQTIREMHRVIKPGGHLFLTFPHLSLFRKLKIARNKYPLFNKDTFNEEMFYQFAFDDNYVIEKIVQNKFEFLYKKQFDGVKGLMEEIDCKILKKFLKKIYASKNILARIFKALLSIIIAPLTGHIVLIVFKKNED